MAAIDSQITHVSDTALMTAACRAVETARPDGWLCDPFAERLAGERGMAILRDLPGKELMCFGVGMRSRILDDLVAETVATQGITTVLSVGAGLDTRPWQIQLPESLLWVEVDLPPVLDYKATVLANEKPSCRLERLAADVNNPPEREAIFARAGGGPAILITEGLLMYLPAATIEALAAESLRAAGVGCWILDMTTRQAATVLASANTFQGVNDVRAPDHLDGEALVERVTAAGWLPTVRRTYAADGMKLLHPERLEKIIQARVVAEAAGNAAPRPPADDLSGVHLFVRP